VVVEDILSQGGDREPSRWPGRLTVIGAVVVVADSAVIVHHGRLVVQAPVAEARAVHRDRGGAGGHVRWPGPAHQLRPLGITLGFVAGKGDSVAIGAGTLTDWGLGHLVGAALLGAIGVAVGSLVRSQLAAMIGIFAWMVIAESLIGGLFNAARLSVGLLPLSTVARTAWNAGGGKQPNQEAWRIRTRSPRISVRYVTMSLSVLSVRSPGPMPV
jgi:hypothetical protein